MARIPPSSCASRFAVCPRHRRARHAAWPRGPSTSQHPTHRYCATGTTPWRSSFIQQFAKPSPQQSTLVRPVQSLRSGLRGGSCTCCSQGSKGALSGGGAAASPQGARSPLRHRRHVLAHSQALGGRIARPQGRRAGAVQGCRRQVGASSSCGRQVADSHRWGHREQATIKLDPQICDCSCDRLFIL